MGIIQHHIIVIFTTIISGLAGIRKEHGQCENHLVMKIDGTETGKDVEIVKLFTGNVRQSQVWCKINGCESLVEGINGTCGVGDTSVTRSGDTSLVFEVPISIEHSYNNPCVCQLEYTNGTVEVAQAFIEVKSRPYFVNDSDHKMHTHERKGDKVVLEFDIIAKPRPRSATSFQLFKMGGSVMNSTEYTVSVTPLEEEMNKYKVKVEVNSRMSASMNGSYYLLIDNDVGVSLQYDFEIAGIKPYPKNTRGGDTERERESHSSRTLYFFVTAATLRLVAAIVIVVVIIIEVRGKKKQQQQQQGGVKEEGEQEEDEKSEESSAPPKPTAPPTPTPPTSTPPTTRLGRYKSTQLA